MTNFLNLNLFHEEKRSGTYNFRVQPHGGELATYQLQIFDKIGKLTGSALISFHNVREWTKKLIH